ncbi:hypothetical protein IEQ34_021695 [Dendrobium chrysotoxum]|uniref:Uncharacterized protein n=1 Tax=Dendrobium chrysotoxum TaxID=161865 RepID=A0AAV7G5F4_DENCH|nr:hypothetical protein IEQ34_021695 [Dendrobium chrysotoxum]
MQREQTEEMKRKGSGWPILGQYPAVFRRLWPPEKITYHRRFPLPVIATVKYKTGGLTEGYHSAANSGSFSLQTAGEPLIHIGDLTVG